jgi:hypothetical protein
MANKQELRGKIAALVRSVSALRKEIEASKVFDAKVTKALQIAETQLYNADGAALEQGGK